MANDSSVQQQYQNILSYVEEQGLPEGEYLRVSNALRDLYKNIPVKQEKKYQNKRVKTIELPIDLVKLTMWEPTLRNGMESLTVTIPKVDVISYQQSMADNRLYDTTEKMYHIIITSEGKHGSQTNTRQICLGSRAQRWSKVRSMFCPFQPKTVELEINHMKYVYDIKQYASDMLCKAKADYESYKKKMTLDGEDDDIQSFEDWCEENYEDSCPGDIDAYMDIWEELTSAISHYIEDVENPLENFVRQ
jgi:hypothetical protein